MVLSVVSSVSFILGIFTGRYSVSKPEPQTLKVTADKDNYSIVVSPLVLEHAKLWCKLQIANGNLQGGYFEYAVQKIDKKNIRWSINDPDGLHYSMIFAFANAWEKQS